MKDFKIFANILKSYLTLVMMYDFEIHSLWMGHCSLKTNCFCSVLDSILHFVYRLRMVHSRILFCFVLDNVLFCANSLYYFLCNPFFAGSRIGWMIFFTIDAGEWFTAVLVVMSYCTAVATSKISSTRCL